MERDILDEAAFLDAYQGEDPDNLADIKLLLKYQAKAIALSADHVLLVIEKSRRTGISYAFAADAVLAAKRMDDLWRKKRAVPTCPHCGSGLLPEDTERMGRVSKEIEIARRKREADHG